MFLTRLSTSTLNADFPVMSRHILQNLESQPFLLTIGIFPLHPPAATFLFCMARQFWPTLRIANMTVKCHSGMRAGRGKSDPSDSQVSLFSGQGSLSFVSEPSHFLDGVGEKARDSRERERSISPLPRFGHGASYADNLNIPQCLPPRVSDPLFITRSTTNATSTSIDSTTSFNNGLPRPLAPDHRHCAYKPDRPARNPPPSRIILRRHIGPNTPPSPTPSEGQSRVVRYWVLTPASSHRAWAAERFRKT